MVVIDSLQSHLHLGVAYKMQNAKVRTRQRVKCEMKCENILYFIGDTQSALVTDWFEFFPWHCTLHVCFPVVFDTDNYIYVRGDSMPAGAK